MKNQAMECLTKVVAEKINEGYVLSGGTTIYSYYEHVTELRKGKERIALVIVKNYKRDEEICKKHNIRVYDFYVHDVVFIPDFNGRRSEGNVIASFYKWKNCCSADIEELLVYVKRKNNSNFIDNLFNKKLVATDKLFTKVSKLRGFKSSKIENIIIDKMYSGYQISTLKSQAEIWKRLSHR